MPWNTLVRAMRARFKTKRSREIAPDEIFLDAHNFPRFDTSQFEGRLEKPIRKRTLLFLYTIALLVGVIFLGRIGELQVAQGDLYAALSENNRLSHSILFADRGVLYDRNGTLLAWNRSRNETEDFAERAYADIPGLSHVVGYIQYPQKDSSGIYYQTEYIGTAGVEKSFNNILAGKNGLKIVETNAHAEVMSESVVRPPENGDTITLSVDARIEEAFFRFMEETAKSAPFEGGAGVIMDVKNGEILALVSYPEYRSTDMLSGANEKIAAYQRDPRKPFLNRVTTGLYTPGSIVKPFVAFGALSEGIITPEKKIESTGSLSVPNPYAPGAPTIFRDWKAHGWVNMREALAVSSDVYFYEIGGGYEDQKGLGIANIEKYMRLFGFGARTGTAIGTEEAGVIPNPTWKKENFEDGVWRIGNTYHTAIGQYGFQITPLQAVRATAAIANGGTLFSPTIVRDDTAPSIALSLSQEHLAVVREGMRQAVTAGTASGLWSESVAIAAKTGTAELGTLKKFVNSWIIGFFPYENPRYAFATVMERGPSGNLVGALFVMRRLFDWMALHTPEYLDPASE